ncbi:MAG: hypothetical protein SWH61_12260 [Thermodesulfobacteriota bacterium]|nr:hypothetical protein [Thermodesulfobacteriota bacterium]
MPDGWEVASGLEPLIDDADQDADEDGFTNLEEYLAGTDPGNPSDYPGAVPGANLFFLVIAFLVVGSVWMKYSKKGAFGK